MIVNTQTSICEPDPTQRLDDQTSPCHDALHKLATDVVEGVDGIRRYLSSLPAGESKESDMLKEHRKALQEIERYFSSLLKRNDIDSIDPKGKPFDANLHEATAQQLASEYPSGTVIHAWSQAWTLNGRTLKQAMVVVSYEKSASE